MLVRGDKTRESPAPRRLAWAIGLVILVVGCRHPAAGPTLDALEAGATDLGTKPLAVTGEADVKVALARTRESNDPESAIGFYEEALRLDPKRDDAHARLAVLLDRRGDFKASAAHYEAALKARPDDPDRLCDRGYSLYLQERPAEAERIFRRALKAAPSHARAHNNLGLLLARRGRNDEALSHFAAAGESPADARANLAFAQALEGRKSQARASYTQALAVDPRCESAKKGLAILDRTATTGPAAGDTTVIRASGTTQGPVRP